MDAPIVANRRKNLKDWIDLNYSGSQAKFIAATEINQGELSALLKNKSFGEKKARSIERAANMPTMWLDNANQAIQYNNNGNGTQNNLINSSQTNISGSLPETPPTQIQQDDSMMPLIPQGSPLWADPADTALQNGKTYLIEYGGLQAVRRLFAEAGGQIRIKPHNPDYSETTLPAEQVRIIGRIVRWCVHD